LRGKYALQQEHTILQEGYKFSYIRVGHTYTDIFLSFFVETLDKFSLRVGCRSPPINLDFKKIQIDWRKTIWHTTKPEKKRNGVYGNKPKKRNCIS